MEVSEKSTVVVVAGRTPEKSVQKTYVPARLNGRHKRRCVVNLAQTFFTQKSLKKRADETTHLDVAAPWLVLDVVCGSHLGLRLPVQLLRLYPPGAPAGLVGGVLQRAHLGLAVPLQLAGLDLDEKRTDFVQRPAAE